MTEQSIVGQRFRIDCVVIRPHDNSEGVYLVRTQLGDHWLTADDVERLCRKPSPSNATGPDE